MTNGIREIGPCSAEAEAGRGGTGAVDRGRGAQPDRAAAINLPPSHEEWRPIKVRLDWWQVLAEGDTWGSSL